MDVDITDPIFHDEDKAREYFEGIRWPNGPYCLHCGSFNVHRLEGKSHRAGLLYCRECREHFTVTVKSVYERSHVPLHKWMLAAHLLASSKKGISAHQLHRMLKVNYRTAWFMAYRLREAMTEHNPPALGGSGEVVEADEAYKGKKEIPTPSPARRGRPYIKKGKAVEKRPIFALVERGGEARAFSMPIVSGKNIRDAVVRHADRKSRLHMDESPLYKAVGKEFAAHETVNHSAGEYARCDVTTNTVEGFFGIFTRGLVGVYLHVGEQHLQRYLNEFSFRYNNRSRLGIEDTDRAVMIHKGAENKRLTYK